MSFTPYQINFQSEDVGRRVQRSKRQIIWWFGFCDDSALIEGKVGSDCRGTEHRIVLEWSLVSGRRSIYINDEEVYSSKNCSEKLEFSTMLCGMHTQLIGTISDKPSRSNRPNFDLLIEGKSFFSFKRIFELGQEVIPRVGKSVAAGLAIKGGEGSRRRKSMTVVDKQHNNCTQRNGLNAQSTFRRSLGTFRPTVQDNHPSQDNLSRSENMFTRRPSQKIVMNGVTRSTSAEGILAFDKSHSPDEFPSELVCRTQKPRQHSFIPFRKREEASGLCIPPSAQGDENESVACDSRLGREVIFDKSDMSACSSLR